MPKYSYAFQTSADIPALERLTRRINDPRYSTWPLEEPVSRCLPGARENDPFPVRRRRLIQYDESGEIRAFHNFFEHELYVDGEPHGIVWPNTPLSEAVVDPRYVLSYPLLLRHSLSLKPLHIAYSGLSLDSIPGKLYAGMKWTHDWVPFYFLPLRADNILKEMGAFKRSPATRLAAKALAASGLVGLGSFVLSGRKRLMHGKSPLDVEVCDAFGEWTDRVWQSCVGKYGALTRRDAATMNRLYRPGDKRFDRLRLRRNGRDIGWILLTAAIRRNSDPSEGYDMGFGGLRPAVVVDALSAPEDAEDVLRAGIDYLLDKSGDDLDIVFSHWSHAAWRRASDKVGFLHRGNRDYMIFVSAAGQELVLNERCPLEAMHLTEGDCDGPYYIIPEIKEPNPLDIYGRAKAS